DPPGVARGGGGDRHRRPLRHPRRSGLTGTRRSLRSLRLERASRAKPALALGGQHMEPVREIVGRAVPLDRSDVDTDQIIPSDWLKRVERTGFGEGLFSEWRESSDFVLNQDVYDGAQILVAGPNFGTGSSREHAPWALEDYGFRAVISARFADIFRNNCLKIGLLPVELPAEVVTRIMRTVEDDPSVEIVIDVVDRRAAPPCAHREPFPPEDSHHYRLPECLDDIGITLRHVGDIDAFEARRPSWAPRVPA